VNLELQTFLNSLLDAEDWSAYLSDSISQSARDYGRFEKRAVFVPQVAWIGDWRENLLDCRENDTRLQPIL